MTMFYTIGRKRRKEGDLVDTLLECHDRIRTFIDLAVTISERANLHRSEVAEASARIERYYSMAFPLHVEDEESSILPRVRGRSSLLDAALDRMHEQHQVHEDMVRRLCACAKALRVDPRDRASRDALAFVARSLRFLLHDHLEAEEMIVFPAIREHLSRAEERLVRREMEARRRNDG